MKKNYLALTGMAASLALAACGGGGGDSGATTPTSTAPSTTPPATTTPVTTATAEGVYQGTVSNGLTHLTLVLENDEIYSVYGPVSNGIFGISRFLRGNGKSSNGTFTASDVREYASGPSTAGYSFSGTYVAGASLNGTFTGSSNSTFTGATLTNTTYVYNTPAKLANIAGAWTLNDLAGAKVTLTIAADGKFTGISGNCTVSGALSPRASGKNVFDFSLVFGATPCALPGQSASGVAVEFTIGTQRQLIAAGTDATRANGTAFVGAR